MKVPGLYGIAQKKMIRKYHCGNWLHPMYGFGDKNNVANWISDFMDAIEVKHVHIVGHDIGGVIASYFTHGQKRGVNTLAWFNPPDLDGIRAGDIAAWERVKVGFYSMQQAETHLMSLFYDPPTLPGIVKRFYMKR